MDQDNYSGLAICRQCFTRQENGPKCMFCGVKFATEEGKRICPTCTVPFIAGGDGRRVVDRNGLTWINFELLKCADCAADSAQKGSGK